MNTFRKFNSNEMQYIKDHCISARRCYTEGYNYTLRLLFDDKSKTEFSLIESTDLIYTAKFNINKLSSYYLHYNDILDIVELYSEDMYNSTMMQIDELSKLDKETCDKFMLLHLSLLQSLSTVKQYTNTLSERLPDNGLS